MGRKVSDEFTVPLCSSHQQELHAAGNERGWWQSQGIDPEPVAEALWVESRGCGMVEARQAVATQESGNRSGS